jgi:hypothetical protein
MPRETRVDATVMELLSDPIARLLMERDGLQPESVWACLQQTWQRRNSQAIPRRKDDGPTR